jgi:hypothetical protein
MKANRRIFLYGNSVIIGSIGANLRRCSDFEVITLSALLEESLSFDGIEPDILLFDLEATYPEAPFFLLKTLPDLVLIGISPGVNLVRVWNSKQLREMSMQGLLELISNGSIDAPDSPVEPAALKKIGSGQEFKISDGR